ncbi:MAG: response regulator [Cyanobacteriota bacterium]|nr:response regulator [Cyanobacteriota bacterium]
MKTVLVVEDSPSQRECLLNQLHWRGMNAIAAVDGVEALERVQSHNPDLVLLDIIMPRIDGYGACRLIKANPATRHLPIVLITGKGKQTALGRGMRYEKRLCGQAVEIARVIANSSQRPGKCASTEAIAFRHKLGRITAF